MISKRIEGFLDLSVFLLLKVHFPCHIAAWTMIVALSEYKNELTSHFDFDIIISFNDFLSVIDILTFFVKVGQD